jgi:hypothetical protein
MYSDTNTTRSVADAVMKVMNEKLHPNQQKLDVHEPEKDELTSDDFKKLRAGKKATEVKKEEVEQIDELSTGTLKSYIKGAKSDKAAYNDEKFSADAAGDHKTASDAAAVVAKRQAGMKSAKAKLNAEEVDGEETILEYESKDGKFVHNAKTGRYGGSEKPTDPFAGVRGPGQKDLEKIEAEKKKKQKKFSEMVNLYQEKGLKSLSEMLVKEEPTNDEYKAELDDVKAKANGSKKNPDIAKGKVDAVKQEEVEQQDVEQIDEREMTDDEMKKRETMVKSMKKGMAGFKERYGDRATNVMYATATKQAMK